MILIGTYEDFMTTWALILISIPTISSIIHFSVIFPLGTHEEY